MENNHVNAVASSPPSPLSPAMTNIATLFVAIEKKNKRQVKAVLTRLAEEDFTYLYAEPSRKRKKMNLLMFASSLGNFEIVQMLLENILCRNSINFVTSDGETALHVAVRRSLEENATILLKSGADPNIQDSLGETPLIVAARNGNEDLCEILLDYEANPNIQNNLGHTALYEAVRREYEYICKLLLNNRADVNQVDLEKRSPLSVCSKPFKGKLEQLILAETERRNQFLLSEIKKNTRFDPRSPNTNNTLALNQYFENLYRTILKIEPILSILQLRQSQFKDSLTVNNEIFGRYLEDLFEAYKSTNKRSIVILGEPQSGKSTFVESFVSPDFYISNSNSTLPFIVNLFKAKPNNNNSNNNNEQENETNLLIYDFTNQYIQSTLPLFYSKANIFLIFYRETKILNINQISQWLFDIIENARGATVFLISTRTSKSISEPIKLSHSVALRAMIDHISDRTSPHKRRRINIIICDESQYDWNILNGNKRSAERMIENIISAATKSDNYNYLNKKKKKDDDNNNNDNKNENKSKTKQWKIPSHWAKFREFLIPHYFANFYIDVYKSLYKYSPKFFAPPDNIYHYLQNNNSNIDNGDNTYYNIFNYFPIVDWKTIQSHALHNHFSNTQEIVKALKLFHSWGELIYLQCLFDRFVILVPNWIVFIYQVITAGWKSAYMSEENFTLIWKENDPNYLNDQLIQQRVTTILMIFQELRLFILLKCDGPRTYVIPNILNLIQKPHDIIQIENNYSTSKESQKNEPQSILGKFFTTAVKPPRSNSNYRLSAPSNLINNNDKFSINYPPVTMYGNSIYTQQSMGQGRQTNSRFPIIKVKVERTYEFDYFPNSFFLRLLLNISKWKRVKEHDIWKEGMLIGDSFSNMFAILQIEDQPDQNVFNNTTLKKRIKVQFFGKSSYLSSFMAPIHNSIMSLIQTLEGLKVKIICTLYPVPGFLDEIIQIPLDTCYDLREDNKRNLSGSNPDYRNATQSNGNLNEGQGKLDRKWIPYLIADFYNHFKEDNNPIYENASFTISQQNEARRYIREVRILGDIGSGITSKVYNAIWNNDQIVAVKIPSSEYIRDQSVNNEVETLKKLNHKNVLRLLTVYQNPFAIITEYCPLGNLATVKAFPNFSGLFALRVIFELSSAIFYLQKSGLIHGDIKPSNIFIKDMNLKAPVCAVLGDVGFCRSVDPMLYDKSGNSSFKQDVTCLVYIAQDLRAVIQNRTSSSTSTSSDEQNKNNNNNNNKDGIYQQMMESANLRLEIEKEAIATLDEICQEFNTNYDGNFLENKMKFLEYKFNQLYSKLTKSLVIPQYPVIVSQDWNIGSVLAEIRKIQEIATSYSIHRENSKDKKNNDSENNTNNNNNNNNNIVIITDDGNENNNESDKKENSFLQNINFSQDASYYISSLLMNLHQILKRSQSLFNGVILHESEEWKTLCKACYPIFYVVLKLKLGSMIRMKQWSKISFIDVGDDQDRRLIHYACEFGDHYLLEKIFKYIYVNPNAQNRSNLMAPIHYAAQMGHLLCLRVLYQHKVNINIIDSHNETAVFKATKAGNYECLHYLLYFMNADPNIRNSEGVIAIQLALKNASKKQNYRECVKLLLQYGEKELFFYLSPVDIQTLQTEYAQFTSPSMMV